MDKNRKQVYLRPDIEVCDYLSRHGLCIEYNPDVSTFDVLGKRDNTFDEADTDDDGGVRPRNLWEGE